MAEITVPENWETPAVTIESYAPVEGPVNNETAADNDYIQAAPPGSHGTVNDDMIGGTVQQAVLLAMNNYGDKEAQTHPQGSALGDLVDMPPAPDRDTTVLTPGPGSYPVV